MTSPLTRGLLAGAAGTTALTAVTYADMALTGRPASTAPNDVVAALLRRAGRNVPGDNSLAGLAALAGIGAGLGVGVLASLLRSAGVRIPPAVGGPAICALAMAASDLPMAALGVGDPRTWTAADWTRDVVPHLAYGVAVRATMDRLDRRRVPAAAEAETAPRRNTNIAGRSLLIGLASGGRSSLGIFAAARLARKPVATAAAATAVVGEIVADKLPTTPSRLEPGPLLGRVATGGLGGWAVARQQGANPVLPTALGLVGGLVGSAIAAAWRQVASDRGWVIQGAVAEDGMSVALAWAALR
ncbi:MAG: hypothetical protein ABJA74_01975 [Lapillicoccus sp.]